MTAIVVGASIVASTIWFFGIPHTQAVTVGPNSGGTFTSDATVGTTAWTTPSNAGASDDADAAVDLAGFQVSQYLKATNYGFSIPAGATIDGIVVDVERSHRTGGACTGLVDDNAARIVKGGTIGTTNRTTATAWSGTDTYASYGGASDLWGETWSVADINSSGFGFALSIVEIDNSDCLAEVDHIRITVNYTASAGGGGEPNLWGYPQVIYWSWHESLV
ncbi:hypothetical protein [Symmachiella dynata]|uniref:hypothetical protein n=1 Tax=Symmachiella dynata TaxID=2527995 RepID=UPI00119E5014|nr:hypothetical protein [Symmachiella dynata]